MIRCPAESGKGGCLQDVLPRLLVNHQPAPAVLPDGFDPFRGIRIFHCGEGGPRFPDPEHRNKRTRVPWKTDQDEILRADSPAFQIAVNPGGQFIRLAPGKTGSGHLFRQENGIRLLPHHGSPALTYIGDGVQEIRFHRPSSLFAVLR